MGQALKVTSELTKLPLADLLPMTSLNQARLLGISAQKGSLEVGKDADIVVLSNDGNLDVQLTMVEGVVVFSQLSQG
jgi:N-acetylglucosamine-6-phosphate deacetylase